MSRMDEIYIELAKDFKTALRLCIYEQTDLTRCNGPNERLCRHEADFPDHVKINWFKSTPENIVLM